VALSWGSDDVARAEHERPRLGLRTSGLVAAVVGAGGEVAVHTVTRPAGPVWSSVRVPLLGALVLGLAQVPYGRRVRAAAGTVRPRRSELARHLDRRTRREP
jgi:hypothetical protein